MKLLQLLSIFANPTFLLSDESHPRLVFFMLESINAILYHHPAENPNVVYAVLKNHALFERLGTFTLASGLREIRRMRAAQQDQEARAPDSSKGKQRAGIEGETAVEEKARLLAEEGRRSPDLEAGQATTSTASGAAGISEKIRGKLRERSESVDLAPTMERALAAEIGRNGFVPTQEWVSWIVKPLQFMPQGLGTDVFSSTIHR
jgi:High-temperature-induced dauer-formation protein